MSGPAVIGGKLKLKGMAPSNKKKRKADTDSEVPVPTAAKVEKESMISSTSASASSSPPKAGGEAAKGDDDIDELEIGLTETQRRHLRRKRELDARIAKSVVTKTFRERVEEFNQKLGSMTEHNDIPRVSAAGNG